MKIHRIATWVAAFSVATAAFAQKAMTREEYIEKYRKLAVEARDTHGIPASITMAQALLESDCGNSRLATEANNHFGIKCKKDWTGETISHDDDAKGECFRKYACVEDSYRDHSVFLESSPRYAALFKLAPTDYQGWAYGLKQAGYATNPEYATLLIKLIEDHKLFLLDDVENIPPADFKELTPPVKWTEWSETGPHVDVDSYMVSLRTRGGYAIYTNNGSEFAVARAGDTFEALAGKLGVPAPRLRKFNDLSAEAQPAEGDMVYIKAKARKATNGKLIHVVESGETMRSVAQKYGIRLRSLASMNHRSADSQLAAGQQLRLM